MSYPNLGKVCASMFGGYDSLEQAAQSYRKTPEQWLGEFLTNESNVQELERGAELVQPILDLYGMQTSLPFPDDDADYKKLIETHPEVARLEKFLNDWN